MTALAETSLSADERALIERFVEELHARLDGAVHATRSFWTADVSPRSSEFLHAAIEHCSGERAHNG